MSKNVVETERPQMTSQYGAYALYAGWERLHTHGHAHTHTHKYVIFICLHGNSGYMYVPQCYVLRALCALLLIAIIITTFDTELTVLLPVPISTTTSNIKSWISVKCVFLLISVIGPKVNNNIWVLFGLLLKIVSLSKWEVTNFLSVWTWS